MKQDVITKYKSAAESGKPYSWLNYQPINLPGYEETIPLRGRDCFDRSEAIFNHLNTIVKHPERMITVVDWGSNLGFFCFVQLVFQQQLNHQLQHLKLFV